MDAHPHRDRLPQLDGSTTFLTDGGLETCLIFHDGRDLPGFASFPLAFSAEGRDRLVAYFEDYLAIARDLGMGFLLEAPTWRANVDWARQIGIDEPRMLEAIDRLIELLDGVRARWADDLPVVLSGCIGPRGDGYAPDSHMSAGEAEAYHGVEIERMAAHPIAMASALTMTYVDEAVGVAAAAARADLPVAVSFTVETDGRLPDGTPLGEAVEATDAATGGYPAYYMVNCAHPTHLVPGLDAGAPWAARVRGLRANASTLSHAELDEATELDAGDPLDLARRYVGLRRALPGLTVLGGCCGTDHRHVETIAQTWAGVSA